MNILYIGSAGPLSIVPLQALINSNHNICAIAFDDDLNSDFTIANSDSLRLIALNNSIPVINLKHSDKVSQIQSYQPDIILVSCYARLLPQSILAIAKKGSFNIHPSLLPAFRGPNPLFWQFREGIDNFGVTLHRMADEFDTGNIISQEKVVIHDGVSAYDASKLLAKVASSLVLKMLDNIENDTISEIVQNKHEASYQSYPTNQDYSICISWTAKRIFNFIKAYKGTGVSFLCEVNKNKLKFTDVYSYQNNPYFNMKGSLFVQKDKVVTLACQSGYIQGEIIV